MSDTRLYLGDCLDILPTLEAGSVDVVITDPPYGMNYSSNFSKKYKPIVGDHEIPIAWTRELKRITERHAQVYWFTKESGVSTVREALISLKFALYTMLVWDKQQNSSGNLKDYGSRTEYIVFATKGGSLKLNGSRDSNLISVPRVNSAVALHPNEKPLPLIEYLIIKSSNPGDTILDPFMGSGTTGVACVQTGRNFIGIEIDPTYYAIAEKRIAQAKLQIRMPL